MFKLGDKISIKELLNLSDEDQQLLEQKRQISEKVWSELNERGLSIRQTALNIEGIGAAQVSRVLHGENYNIETLLKILNYLDLKLEVLPRKK